MKNAKRTFSTSSKLFVQMWYACLPPCLVLLNMHILSALFGLNSKYDLFGKIKENMRISLYKWMDFMAYSEFQSHFI